jgi:hypothetical protein
VVGLDEAFGEGHDGVGFFFDFGFEGVDAFFKFFVFFVEVVVEGAFEELGFELFDVIGLLFELVGLLFGFFVESRVREGWEGTFGACWRSLCFDILISRRSRGDGCFLS